jgi:antitoxin (DNA-binding transcriptional repressor) of toxin-antitoxin stability system
LASCGETVLVTDRDRVVAEIVPPQPGRRAISDDEFLAQGVRECWLTPASNPGGDPPRRKPIMPLQQLLKELDEDRTDR